MTKWKFDKCDFIRIKYIYSVKNPAKWIKGKATNWEKIFSNSISDTRLVPRIYKGPLKINNKNIII